MNIYKIAQYTVEAYHGTPSVFDKFDISFSGEGHDQEGPGIYFSSDYDDAWRYVGENGKVFHVRLNFNKLVPVEGELNPEEIKQLLLWSIGVENEGDLDNIDMEVFWESSLSSWAESPYEAIYVALDSILKYTLSPHDAFQQVWIDNYRYNPIDYLKNMVRLGYDGVAVPKGGGVIHYIVFNPSIIEVLKS